MRINPSISASAINRYEKVVRQQASAAQGLSTTDKIELSEQAKLYSSLIQTARSSDEVSTDKIHAVMNKIASGSYHVDVRQLAAKMLSISEGDQGDE